MHSVSIRAKVTANSAVEYDRLTFWNPQTLIPALPSFPPNPIIAPPVPSRPSTNPIDLRSPIPVRALAAFSAAGWCGFEAVLEVDKFGDLNEKRREPVWIECSVVVGSAQVESVDESSSSLIVTQSTAPEQRFVVEKTEQQIPKKSAESSTCDSVTGVRRVVQGALE